MRPVSSSMRPPSESNRVCMPSRRLSIDISRCSDSGTASSLFFGGEQRMRWCSLVCLPELRDSSGAPSESHASHMKRLSDRTAWHVSKSSHRATQSFIQVGTNLRKEYNTKTGKREPRCIYRMLASPRSEVGPVWRFVRRFPPYPSSRSRPWKRLPS